MKVITRSKYPIQIITRDKIDLHRPGTKSLRWKIRMKKCPFFGSRRMTVTLGVNREHIQRLMRILGIEAFYPKPNLSRPAPGKDFMSA